MNIDLHIDRIDVHMKSHIEVRMVYKVCSDNV